MGKSGLLTPEGKAFHEGVQNTVRSFQTVNAPFMKALQAISTDNAQLQASFDQLVQDVKALAAKARQLPAPPGDLGQAYHSALHDYLNFKEKAVQTDLKQMLDMRQSPTKDAPAKILELGSRMGREEQAASARLGAAQSAFIIGVAPTSAQPTTK